MRAGYKRDYSFAYDNLCKEYERMKSELTNIGFQDKKLASTIDGLQQHSMSDDMFIGLAQTKSVVVPLYEQIQKEDFFSADDQQFEINCKLLNQLLCRFIDKLDRIIADIKLQCIENGLVANLLRFVDNDNINLLDESGNTLLMQATSYKYPSINIVNKLLELGADPFTICRFNETPFSKAINNDNWVLARNYLARKVNLLGQEDASKKEELRGLDTLYDASDAETFYHKLVEFLSSPQITSSLGLDEASTDICLVHINENYEALGKDSDALYT